MSIFVLNMPFAIEKHISLSAPSSKMNRRFVWQKRCGSNKIFLLIMRQFICAPNVRSVKRDAAPTRKKSARSNLVHNLRGEFDPHRHLCRKASVRQCNGAGMILPYFNLRAERVLLIYKAGIYWRTEQFAPHRLIAKWSPIHFAVTIGNGNKTFFSKTTCSNWK